MPVNKTALLVMDVQNGIVQRFAEKPGIIAPLQRAVNAARRAGVPVIFVRVAFRAGYPEVSAMNKSFSAIAGRRDMTFSDASTQIHDVVAPRPDEPVVTKLRVSAFTGSDLEVILRSSGVDTLVLTGIATSGVVLSTLREAADKDYGWLCFPTGALTPIRKSIASWWRKLFPRQADVLTVDEWADTLS